MFRMFVLGTLVLVGVVLVGCSTPVSSVRSLPSPNADGLYEVCVGSPAIPDGPFYVTAKEVASTPLYVECTAELMQAIRGRKAQP